MHTQHSDIHDAGLADGCEGCARHAAQPWNTLDRDALHDLVQRTLRNRFGGPGKAYGDHVEPRSTTEAVAMAGVMTQLERFGAFAATVPAEVALYLHDRWHTSLPVYTSDDPENHQGDTCPLHEGGAVEDAGVRMLFDGLGVESITELAALVRGVTVIDLDEFRAAHDDERWRAFVKASDDYLARIEARD